MDFSAKERDLTEREKALIERERVSTDEREREVGIEREKEMDSIIYEILRRTRNVISLPNLLEKNEFTFDWFLTDFVSHITPLHIAIQHRSVGFAREILRRKPQLAYALNSQGCSPLRMASANGSADIVRELLLLIGDVSHDRDSKGWTPVHAAAMRGHVDVLKEFNETNPEWIRDITDRDETVLHLYVKYNDSLDALKTLICSEGPGNQLVNPKDENENTILHLAAMKGHVDVFNETNREWIRGITDRGETVLHLCVKYNKLDALKMLIGLVGPDNQLVNRKDENGNTILHLAAMKKDMEMITYLISPETGLDINAVNMNGFTALDFFALYPSNSADTNMVKKLQENGAEGSQEAKATSELQNVLMLVGTLTATLCFQAALVPPGGLWQDDSNMGNNTLDKTNHTAGTSILADKEPNMFRQFQIFNQIVFLLSLILILAGAVVRRRNTLLVKVLLFLPGQLYLPLVLTLVSVMIYLCNKVNTPKGLPHEIRWNLNASNITLFALTLDVCSLYFIFNLVSNYHYIRTVIMQYVRNARNVAVAIVDKWTQ